MPRTRVKFCGVTRPGDAAAAAAAGADAVGMILHADARRRVPPDAAARIVAALPPFVAAVGVFVNAGPGVVEGLAAALALSAAQLHGDETPDDVRRLGPVRVIKAVRCDDRVEATLDAWRKPFEAGDLPNLVGLLIDGPSGGGTGAPHDAGRVRRLIDDGALAGLPPLILAGGLRAETVGDAVARVRPYAVDTSSGVEAAFGEKSADKMRAFVRAVRQADASA